MTLMKTVISCVIRMGRENRVSLIKCKCVRQLVLRIIKNFLIFYDGIDQLSFSAASLTDSSFELYKPTGRAREMTDDERAKPRAQAVNMIFITESLSDNNLRPESREAQYILLFDGNLRVGREKKDIFIII